MGSPSQTTSPEDPAASLPGRTGSRRPSAVRVLVRLALLTGVATGVVETLVWWHADGGVALTVRTGWALLRAVGFVLLAWYVHRGRVVARPFALVLAVTTVFAVARIAVGRAEVPLAVAAASVGVVVALCAVVVGVAYRSPSTAAWLRRHPYRLVVDRRGLALRRTGPRSPLSSGALTTRVAVAVYSPLILVPAAVSAGTAVPGRLGLLAVALAWIGFGVVIAYGALAVGVLLRRRSRHTTPATVVLTALVLAVDLPLCLFVLGLDGLVRDGGPLVAAALLAGWGLWAARTDRSPAPGRSAVAD